MRPTNYSLGACDDGKYHCISLVFLHGVVVRWGIYPVRVVDKGVINRYVVHENMLQPA
jgi:hypothetical protein